MPPVTPQPEQLEPILEALLVQQKQMVEETNALLQAILVNQNNLNTEPLLEALLVQSKASTDKLTEAILSLKIAIETQKEIEMADTTTKDILTALTDKIDQPQDVKVTLTLT